MCVLVPGHLPTVAVFCLILLMPSVAASENEEESFWLQKEGVKEPSREDDSFTSSLVKKLGLKGSWLDACSFTDSWLWRVGAPVAAGGAAVVAVPAAVKVAGFGAGGIAAGSLAAKGMSLAASTGYGMSMISGLQSIGAAGLESLHGGHRCGRRCWRVHQHHHQQQRR